ncbi:hypothetical protein N5C93_30815 [Pseudomonas nitroreducens]|uniref:hypothetical protein n=3 Tax=Pseudomonas TaxID=286 RepID=UPI00244D1CA6|nr:hypothetical protein [Pseudomonas nitroreducens]MDG9858422.1 hypothetical protein [Pseudomonas nitroreducens]MDH1077232.1 hypothetical protein [Pseudomonas nitroreducens]
MDFDRDIRAGANRAEALIGKYLGLRPGNLDLAELDISALDGVSADFKRCALMIQDLAAAPPSRIAAKKMMILVDALGELVKVPRLRQPLMAMWELEESLSTGAGLMFVRHALVILLIFLGVGFVSPVMHGVPMAISYTALIAGYVSLALGLTHFKNSTAAFFIGCPLALVAGAGIIVLGNETLLMAALLLVSLGMFIKNAVTMVRSRTRPARHVNNGIPFVLETDSNLFDDEGDPFMHNVAGTYPYAADD